MYAKSGNITIKKTSDNSTIETIDVTGGQVTGSGSTQITVNPSSDLTGSTEYYVLIDAQLLMMQQVILCRYKLYNGIKFYN